MTNNSENIQAGISNKHTSSKKEDDSIFRGKLRSFLNNS